MKIDENKNNIKNNDIDIAYNLKETNLIKKDTTELKSDKIYLKYLDNLIYRTYIYTLIFNEKFPFYKKDFNLLFKKMIL